MARVACITWANLACMGYTAWHAWWLPSYAGKQAYLAQSYDKRSFKDADHTWARRNPILRANS